MKPFFLFILIAAFLHTKAQQDISNIKVQLDSLSSEIPGLTETVDFTLVNAPIQELLRGVAETHNLNVSLNSLPQVSITNNFNNVMVKDLLVFVCQEYDLRIRFTNNIFSFSAYQIPDETPAMVSYDVSNGLVSFDVQNIPLRSFVREFTSITGINLVASQQVENQAIQGYISRLPVDLALQNIADINKLELMRKEGDVYQLVGTQVAQPNNQNNRRSRLSTGNADFNLETFQIEDNYYVSLSCSRTPIFDLLRTIGDQLNINYLFLTEPQGFMNCRLDSVLFEDFLNIALETGRQSYSQSSGIYVIGDSQNEALNEVRVYSFKNRSVEGVDQIIPPVLSQQAQVQIFNDLNAIIITGSERATEKLLTFLGEIDKPIRNILIEVIVADIRKGSSLRTGVQAFLSDSVPATQGQIFGGVDVTLSSASINRVLNNLDSRGVVNLGRVTPQFYATIQAMEDNNNIKIRSTPKLSTLNGHEATLTIGQSVYYLIETQNVTGGVNPIVTVTPRYERVEANLDLKINPFVSDLEDVTLTIEAEFSDFIPPEIEGAPPGNATRKFISKIRVKNEETVVMGGLEEASQSDVGSGVPLLSRIPIIKWLFSSRTRDDSDNKLLIFIKPTIIY